MFDFDDFFERHGFQDFFGGLLFSVLLGVVCVLGLFYFSNFFVLTEPQFLLLAIIFFVTPGFLLFFYLNYVDGKKKESVESCIPDVLLQASSFPVNTPMSRILFYLSNSNMGLISSEFEKVVRDIDCGASVVDALENMKFRNKSKSVDRMVNLLIQGYSSGADMKQIFKETAEDLLATNNILRERSANMVIQKATILLAGAILVPVILGLVVNMVANLDLGENTIFGGNPELAKRLAEVALFGNQVYLVEYALISSVFVASLENDLKKSLIYVLMLVPVSLICYNLIQQVSFI